METQDYAFEPGLTVGELLKSSQKDWQAAINHRFIKELFAGTVENKVLTEYLIQDYHFFDAFLSMLGACVAHADQLESKLRFAKQLGFLEADEEGIKSIRKRLSRGNFASCNKSLSGFNVFGSGFIRLLSSFGHVGYCRRSLFRLGF